MLRKGMGANGSTTGSSTVGGQVVALLAGKNYAQEQCHITAKATTRDWTNLFLGSVGFQCASKNKDITKIERL
jgi:hypothetical protein